MLARRWLVGLFFSLLMFTHYAHAVDPPPTLDETLRLSRWGYGRATYSFSTDAKCGELSVEAIGPAPRVWMHHIRLNGRHLALGFHGRKTKLVFRRQVDLQAENHLRVVLMGRPQAKFSIKLQPCSPSPPPPTAILTPDPATIHHSDDCAEGLVESDRCASALTWETTNADECWIEPDIGDIECTGRMTVSPGETTTYTLIAEGPGGSAETSADLTVVRQPQAELAVSDSEIVEGETATLEWATAHANSVEIQPKIGQVAAEGVISVKPVVSTIYTLTATGTGGVVTRDAAVTVTQPQTAPTVSFLPEEVSIAQGESVILTWTATSADAAFLDNGIGAVPVEGEQVVSPEHTTTYTITVKGPHGVASAQSRVQVLGSPDTPPRGSFGEDYADLIPPDATIERYDPKRFALINGDVFDIDDQPIEGVSITIHKHPEYGTVVTDAEGRFIIPVEGGGSLIVCYSKPGFLPMHRKIWVPWRDFAVADSVRLTKADPSSTEVVLDGDPEKVFVHRSSPVRDSYGERSTTLVISGDNKAYVKDEDGRIMMNLHSFAVRATEYPSQDAMPAKLPPYSAFTYCVELSVDGVQRIRFAKPVVAWVDNFIGFAVGTAVPVGIYDRDKGVWTSHPDGVVVRLLDTDSDGVVDGVDATGNDLPNDLDGDGSVVDEVRGLDKGVTYLPGTTYWRSEITHFSPCDENWPYGPPEGAVEPADSKMVLDQQLAPAKDCSIKTGSYAEARSRIMHEEIVLPGTNMHLHYASNRVAGYQEVIHVPVTGSSVPEEVKEVQVELTIAGRRFEKTLAPLPEQSLTFIWDRRDWLGRMVKKTANATLTVGYVYAAYYYGTGKRSAWSFNLPGARMTARKARQQVVLNNTKTMEIELHNRQDTIANGWTLSPHHTVDPLNPKLLFKGDGSTPENLPGIETIAGTGDIEYGGDGGPAKKAPIGLVEDLDFGPDGSLFIAERTNHRVRKISPDGIITTVAGDGDDGNSSGNTGDGGPAVNATVCQPVDVEVDDEGNLYIVHKTPRGRGNMVRRVGKDGIISTVAGMMFSKNLYPEDSVEAVYQYIAKFTKSKRGYQYFIDRGNSSVRVLDPGGVKNPFAGAPYFIDMDVIRTGLFSGDGGPAVLAEFFWPQDFVLGQNGAMIIADTGNGRLRKVDISGTITTIAGNGSHEYADEIDGKKAIETAIAPHRLAVDRNGDILFYDIKRKAIFRIGPEGKLSKVLGKTAMDPDRIGLLPSYADIDVRCFALSPEGDLYFYDNNNHTVRAVLGNEAANEPNGLNHTFLADGRHDKTYDQQTGRTLLTFSYNSDDRLDGISDRYDNQIKIVRDSRGVPTAIESTDGIITGLTINAANQLEAITYPNGAEYRFDYTGGSLLVLKTDPNNNRFERHYDETGRLTATTDENDGTWTYERIQRPGGAVRTETVTAEGNVTQYWDQTIASTGSTSQIISPDGFMTVYQDNEDKGFTMLSAPNGMRVEQYKDVDPQNRYAFLTKALVTTPSGLSRETIRNNTYEDTDGDGRHDRTSYEIMVNGASAQFVHDLLTSERFLISPEGRTLSTSYNPDTLLTESFRIPGLNDTEMEYDGHGRLVSIESGSRRIDFVYDDRGLLSKAANAIGWAVTFERNAVGGITAIHRPDGSTVRFDYDPGGNLTKLTTPSGVTHWFGYNKVNLHDNYTPPSSGSYTYLYDRDRRLTQAVFPSGRQLLYIYSGAQFSQLVSPDRTIDYQYRCCGQLTSVTDGTNGLEFEWDGTLLKTNRAFGVLDSEISYSYDNNFHPSELRYADGGELLSYDEDGLLIQRGAFEINREASNGLPLVVMDGNYTEVRQHNGHGEINGMEITINTVTPFTWILSRDEVGRIVRKSETIGGDTIEFEYDYDEVGHLRRASRNGTTVETYTYDGRGVRTSESNRYKGETDVPYAYSDENHLLTVGDVRYTYDVDGFLTSKIENGKITTYQYNLTGELLEVVLPDGNYIAYDYDPLGRRISKRINGVIVEKYLWKSLTRLMAVYDGADNLTMRFRYTDARMPVAMTYNGNSYYLLYDPVGSLRMVIEENGDIVKQIDYDSFGHVISDSAPSFTIPFGFAGGLCDTDTHLVRFGQRDYDPFVGRWTAKDPIFFASGDMDLYGYVRNNPVNYIDPEGLEIRVYSSDAFGISGMNHAFVYSTETGGGKGTAGSLWVTKGDGVGDLTSPYLVVPLPPEMSEVDFMMNITEADGWNNWVWTPYVNDCHSDLENAFEQTGVPYPGAPNGRVDIDDKIRNGITDVMRQLNNPQSLYRLFGGY